MGRGAKFVITVTFLLVMLSLGLNGYLIWQLLEFRQQALHLQQQAWDLQQVALQVLSRSIEELEGFNEATFEYTLQIDEEIPIQAVIPLQDSMDVPIRGTIPIREEIQTTVTLEMSQFGLSIPLDVTIPVVLDVPVDIQVPIAVDRQIPIRTTVPLTLEVPIVIPLEETGLARYVELLQQGLKDLERDLAQMGE